MTLKIVADAFKELAVIVSSPSPDVSVKQFANACSLFSNLFGVLEIAFKFVKTDYVAKASSSISTLEVMVDEDIKAGRAKKPGSHTRNLLKTKRGLEMIRVLFEEIIATNANSSLKDAAYKAYNKVLAKHHGLALQESAETGMESLPSRELLLCMINETEESAKIHMQSYVTASIPVTAYVDQLLCSKNLGIDW
ncbi:accelerated cell death 11 isoform X2 [Arabidopsis lyrata subsp. lyrata]|uniref:accelerated cell death 11 isoform X2 n=1 Tax=Arabidopsis lyrata subsp. lyrata TaxID=81972 RepID=UPI000A29B718|nr:accelerated cell death 11 isoform X2 [Arabidopsis lyrata subsp. lyrata]|eukprot:XP_020871247.1 accelerated cell death 11 isoform X2 [Arabidopsis lyrata subsp. lyrata]